MNKLPLWAKIVIAAVLCLAIGLLSGLSNTDALTGWYVNLNKPSFNPPNWIFGPVWTVLYIMMGISAGLIWDAGWSRPEVKTGIFIFIAQMVFNALWSVVFFGMENPPFALGIIIVLWVLILVCILRFIKINKTAAYLLIPYLLWVSFATALNTAIVVLN